MKTETTKGGQNDKKLIILGFVSIGILFLIYARFEYQEITPDAVQSIQRLGTAFYILFAISIGMIGVGLRKFQKRVAATGNTTALSMICSNTLGSKAKKTFVITFIIYGIFFSMTSGILVYQPEVIFSYHYGADVPSAHVTPCCGPPGYMPKFVAYLTEHVGINVVSDKSSITNNCLIPCCNKYSISSKCNFNYKKDRRAWKHRGGNRIIHSMPNLRWIIFVTIHWSNKCGCIYNCNNRIADIIHCNHGANIDFDAIYYF